MCYRVKITNELEIKRVLSNNDSQHVSGDVAGSGVVSDVPLMQFLSPIEMYERSRGKRVRVYPWTGRAEPSS